MCENKAVAILNKMQEGKTTLIKKDGGEMLIAIVLDKPLSEAQALVDDSDAFMLEITKIIQNKHAHPVIAHFFFRPTPLGFRQVLPHVQLHVAKNR